VNLGVENVMQSRGEKDRDGLEYEGYKYLEIIFES
jgi:hypothetical protein